MIPLEHACAVARIDGNGARLIHMRANVVYELPNAGAIARLRRTRGSLEWECRLRASVHVTRLLAQQGFPAVVPLDIEQPVVVDGWTPTFWRFERIDDSAVASSVHLGELLRRLHAFPALSANLPDTNPLGSLSADLAHDEIVSPEQREWLQARAEEIRKSYEHAEMPLDRGLIHGDAHTGNLFQTGGRFLFGDWDSVSYGPRAQDLIPTLDGIYHFGQHRSDWPKLCATYGISPEIEDHPGMQLLMRARELRSLAAYIRTADLPEVRTELDKRLRELMGGQPKTWRPV